MDDGKPEVTAHAPGDPGALTDVVKQLMNITGVSCVALVVIDPTGDGSHSVAGGRWRRSYLCPMCWRKVEERPLRSAQNRSPFIEEEVDMETLNSSSSTRRVPWNKGRLTGQKPPLKLREIWAIRTRLQMSSMLFCTESGPRGGADKILDYLEVVHVLVRRPHSSSSALFEVGQAH
jgi:hypothetical protein